ncbi:MAG TPA: hypothetical protein VF720_04975, partial [Candidatus Eisenbacteria bacterium]
MPSFRTIGLCALLLTAAVSPAGAITADRLLEASGEAAADWFGHAVVGGFDFNGDGYDDVAISAPFLSTAILDAGRVYIHFRGPGADGVADVTLTGLTVDDNLGWSFSSGDFNNDGYDDLVVAALDCCAYKGIAYIFLGGAVPDNVADLTMTGAANDDLYGYSVSGAGDLNGDGFDDWIIGAPQNDTGGSNAGRAYVYLGGSTLNSVIDLTLTGEAAGDQFGGDLSGVGDINNDGYDDWAVMADRHDGNGTNAGRAYLYYGGSTLNSTVDLVVDGVLSDYLGRVSGAGDMNGDGYDDWAVGAFVSGTSSSGVAHVLFGGAIPNAVPDITINGGSGDSLGFALAGGGDVDGDGYDDLVVGVPGGDSEGEVQVFRGGPLTDARADLVLTGDESYDRFGYAVALAGDENGDGASDLVVGAIYGGSGGKAYVYGLNGWRLVSPNGGEQWVTGQPAVIRWRGRELTDVALSTDAGASWTTLVEDAGGALENEIVIDAPATTGDAAMVRLRIASLAISPSSTDVSDATFRIVGPHEPPAAAYTQQATLVGAALGDAFGVAVAGAGDLNGDGFDDIVTGANGNDAAGTSAGRVYIHFGGADFDTTADLVLSGILTGDSYGTAVDAAGDVNGDGFDDLVVGSVSHDGTFVNGGAAFVYFGGSPMNGLADWTLLGTQTSESFGGFVAGAGDVNGDGYDDIVVGAPGNDVVFTNAGAAYLYLGGSAPDAVADWIVYGAASSDGLGAVDGVGDVNRDGYADLVVGASGNDAGGSNAGRAYVHF